MVDARAIHFPVKNDILTLGLSFTKGPFKIPLFVLRRSQYFLGGHYPPRLKAEVDNTLHALHNSYHPTQPHSIIANANANANDNDSDNYTDSDNDNDNNNDNYNNILIFIHINQE